MKHCMLCIPVCTIGSHCIFYCSLLNSTALINLENACEYFAIRSLLVVGHVPSLVFNGSKYSFVIVVFCSHILSVLMTEPHHRRGTLDYTRSVRKVSDLFFLFEHLMDHNLARLHEPTLNLSAHA